MYSLQYRSRRRGIFTGAALALCLLLSWSCAVAAGLSADGAQVPESPGDVQKPTTPTEIELPKQEPPFLQQRAGDPQHAELQSELLSKTLQAVAFEALRREGE